MSGQKKVKSMAYSKITMPEFSRLEGLQSTDLNPIDNLWDVLEKAVLSGLILPSSTQNLGVKLLDVNKCCDIAKAYQNNAIIKATTY